MILSNQKLHELISLYGLVSTTAAREHVQPCSVDVHLQPKLQVHTGPYIDDSDPEWNNKYWKDVPIEEDEKGKFWLLYPGKLYLGVLVEYIYVPSALCGDLRGVSSRARSGIVVHQQAGLLDPGWSGYATCEISVIMPTKVRPFDKDGNPLRIGQVVFTMLDQIAYPTYQGRYQGDTQPQPAKPGN